MTRMLLSMTKPTTGTFVFISLFSPGKTADTRLDLGVAKWVLRKRVVILLIAFPVVPIKEWVSLSLRTRVLLSVTRHRP